LFVISYWIGFEIQVADLLLGSLFYCRPYKYHMDICTQWAYFACNCVACTYIL